MSVLYNSLYDAGVAAATSNTILSAAGDEKGRVAQLRFLVESLSRDIHRIAVDLRPTSLDDLGLMPALRALRNVRRRPYRTGSSDKGIEAAT